MNSEKLSDERFVIHYQELVAQYRDMSPMLDLVEVITKRQYAEYFKAHVSIDKLCICNANNDVITINYVPAIKHFEIRFFNKTSNKVNKHKVECSQSLRFIDALVLRLYILESGEL